MHSHLDYIYSEIGLCSSIIVGHTKAIYLFSLPTIFSTKSPKALFLKSICLVILYRPAFTLYILNMILYLMLEISPEFIIRLEYITQNFVLIIQLLHVRFTFNTSCSNNLKSVFQSYFKHVFLPRHINAKIRLHLILF